MLATEEPTFRLLRMQPASRTHKHPPECRLENTVEDFTLSGWSEHTDTHIPNNTHTHADINTHTHTHADINTHTHADINKHTHMQTSQILMKPFGETRR